jgi:hypothetical protein
VAEKFKDATQRTLGVAKGWKAFQDFKQQPGPFLSAVVALVSLEPTSVQHALRGLAIKNILSKSPRGVYTFESVAFERWVRTLAP